jgi:hypothetical protein
MKDFDEDWKNIEGYDYYMVSNLGNVKSIERCIIRKDGRKHTRRSQPIKIHKNRYGYMLVGLRITGKGQKWFSVHRLVARHFIGVSSLDVNHIDGNKGNNNVLILEYVTKSQNTQHMLNVLNVGPRKIDHMKALAIYTCVDIGKNRKGPNNNSNYEKLANKLGVKKTSVYQIARGKLLSELHEVIYG